MRFSAIVLPALAALVAADSSMSPTSVNPLSSIVSEVSSLLSRASAVASSANHSSVSAEATVSSTVTATASATSFKAPEHTGAANILAVKGVAGVVMGAIGVAALV